jgi:hypothetical protein
LDAEHEVGGAVDSSVLGSRGKAGRKSKGDDVGKMEEEEDEAAQILKSSLYSDFSSTCTWTVTFENFFFCQAEEVAAGVAAMNMSMNMSNMSTAAEVTEKE